jgi:hypothetical protein
MARVQARVSALISYISDNFPKRHRPMAPHKRPPSPYN